MPMLKRITLAAAATALMLGGAYAQSNDMKHDGTSSMDKGSATGDQKTSPGTTGAMNDVAPNVQKNPGEVQKQQADQDSRRGGGAETPKSSDQPK